MKHKITILTFSILLIANFAIAQDNTSRLTDCNKSRPNTSLKSLEKAEVNYLNALNHQNEGMIESAIVNIMIMKLYFPDRNYDNLACKLNQLVTEGDSESIRLKSFIACNYLKHPERYSWITADSFQNVSNFFELYSEKIAQQLEKTKSDVLIALDK